MKNNSLLFSVATLLILAPLVYLASVYGSLPDNVPLHFGIDGKPDRIGNKQELFVSLGILALVNAGVFLLLTNLHKIDPKKSAKTSQGAIRKIALAVVCLLSVISVMVIYSTQNTNMAMPGLFLPVLGLFFAYLGNLMYSLKPNYFVGIRTPWALEDEDNWRKTHLVAGKLWFGGGVLITILTWLLPIAIGLISMMIIMFIITIIPIVFSYRYFKKQKINQA